MEKKPDVRHVDTEFMHYRLGWLAAVGFILVVVGMIALYAPYYSTFSLQGLIGSFLLIGAALFFADAFESRREGGFISQLLIGSLYLLLSVMIYAAGEAPMVSALLAIFLGLEGMLKLFFSLWLRPRSEWTWWLSSGVVALVLCAAVHGIPPSSPLVCVMAGLDLIYTGLAVLMTAHTMRKTLERGEMLCIGEVCFSE